MGKLRTALKDIVDHMFENQANFEKLETELKSLIEEMAHVVGYIRNGADATLMILTVKLKKEGSTLKGNLKTQLKDVMDADIAKCIKEISKSGDTLLSKYESGKESCNKELTRIRHVIAISEKNSLIITSIVEKKKRQFLINKEKKEKYNYYLGLTQWIEEEIDSQNKSIESIQKQFASEFKNKPGWIKQCCSIDASWTVEDLQFKAERDVQDGLSDYESGNDQILKQVHKTRSELKKIGPQMKKLKEMADDADALEKLS